ncbi:hypothetical protein [Vibrio panuliri]|uniref:Uncharacterized protein n=1 Tax=Vibrio panuliri TaxID=1381081 RepID=A0ABX3FFI1_9VIBR|nr:hypothetical protein [Vibrio panuliri]KAB1460861.1 hypothetical protein F7O85_00355 [Vibrio panuliri]OLQ91667.1 hypothetical protein BIY20_09700 [Vibrio panuliri]
MSDGVKQINVPLVNSNGDVVETTIRDYYMGATGSKREAIKEALRAGVILAQLSPKALFYMSACAKAGQEVTAKELIAILSDGKDSVPIIKERQAETGTMSFDSPLEEEDAVEGRQKSKARVNSLKK